MSIRVGVDVTGGDFFPRSPIEGAIAAHIEKPGIEIVLVGNRQIIEDYFREKEIDNPFEIIHSPTYIDMGDNPVRSITTKQDSSIVVGLRSLREGKLDAFVSAGNTGAVVAGSVLIIGTVEGVSRPTLAAIFPPVLGNKASLICDVGANVDCKPDNLVEFGKLASIFIHTMFKISEPKVALINIGEEETKGNAQTKQAYKLFEQEPNVNFVGNIEGRDIIKNKADVMVCDGFVGNILLKYGESFYNVFVEKLPDDPILEKFDFELTGGLPLLGVENIVIIGHGVSGPLAFKNMIFRASEMKELKLIETIKEKFQ